MDFSSSLRSFAVSLLPLQGKRAVCEVTPFTKVLVFVFSKVVMVYRKGFDVSIRNYQKEMAPN